MNRLKIYAALLLALFAVNGLFAGRHDRHDAIIRKAIRAYRHMNRSAVGWKLLGYSHDMNEIYYREFGQGERTLLIIGGLHGDEPAATIAIIKFGEYLHRCPELLGSRVVLVPCINPDGLIRGTRTNAHKIDINRNFPSETWECDYNNDYNNPGMLPGSEPETILLVNAVYDYRPWMVIQVHQPFGKLFPGVGVPEDLYENMSMLSGYEVGLDIGYKTPGSLGSYVASASRKIPDITFEIGPLEFEPDYERINLALLEAVNYGQLLTEPF